MRAKSGVPISGARIEVQGQPGATRSRTDGRWSFVFPLGRPVAPETLTVTATLLDGMVATLTAAVEPETETPGPDFEF